MKRYGTLILGGGVAAGYAAETFVREGAGEGDLAIVSAETRLPYDRPPLSKDVLQGEEELEETLINEDGFYRGNGIDVFLETRALEVDLEDRTVDTGPHGPRFRFDRLVIATGSRLRTLDVPGCEKEGLHYLRHDRDAEAILDAAEDAARIVVVGGSFLGSEVAASLASDGREITLVHPHDHILQDRPFTQQMASYFEGYFQEKGVTLVPRERVVGLGGNGRIDSVRVESGERIPADLVVAAVGVVPNTSLFEKSGLAVDDGILVDERLETRVEGVYAVGDVARYHDALFDTDRRVEHWDNAQAQGRYVARRITGTANGAFDHLPYFFSDVFDLSWEFWGDRDRADDVVYRGEIPSGSFSAWWLRDDRVVAAFAMDRDDLEREAAQRLIRSRERVDAAALADESVALPEG